MNYKNYLLQLSSGNIAPLTLQRGSEYVSEDTNINALLDLIQESIIAPRYRLFFVNEDDTIRSEIPLEDLLSGGSYTENYQNGQRCSLSLTLFNQSGRYMPTINKLWAGTKIRLDAGQEQQDRSIIWVQKGIFVITSAQPSYSADSRTVSISAGDKFANLEGAVGTLPTTLEIPTGTRILPLVKELLAIQKGNGSPLDSQEPYFHPSLANKVTQTKISKGAGETVGSLILELADQMSAEVFYNAKGRLCFYPVNVVSDDNDKPILFNYLTNKGELTDLNFSLDYSQIINRIILVGATVNGGVVRAEAQNNDPASPLCVQKIGTRTSVINDSNIKTQIVADENARYQLRKQLILKSSVTLNVPYTPLFGVNNLVMITDDFYNLVKQCFLIQSVSFNLDYSPSMSLTVSNLANLPFISSYKLTEDIYDEELQKTQFTHFIRYPITVNLTNGTYRGPSYITSVGVNYLYLLGDEGYRTPYYSGENVTITGATGTYNPQSGIVSLTYPTGPITISGQCYDWWSFDSNVQHGSISGGNSRISIGGSLSITLNSDSNYYVPDNIGVQNADYTYTINSQSGRTQATITLSNPRGPVTLSVACIPPYTISIWADVGASGLWTAEGVTIYDGKFPDFDFPAGTITTPHTSTNATITSGYMTLRTGLVSNFSYYNVSGGLIFDSSVTIAEEIYLIFKVTADGSVALEVDAIPEPPTPVDLTVSAVVGTSGIWPMSGIQIYKGNFITSSEVLLLGDIPTASASPFAEQEIVMPGEYISVATDDPDGVLSTVSSSGADFISQAQYAEGYILVFQIVGNATINITADGKVDYVNITGVKAAPNDSFVWPSTGIQVYDGDYTSSYSLIGNIVSPGETIATPIKTGYLSVAASVSLDRLVAVSTQYTSGGIRFVAKGVVDDQQKTSYIIYQIDGEASLTVGAYATREAYYGVSVKGALASGNVFCAMDVTVGDKYVTTRIAGHISTVNQIVSFNLQVGVEEYITIFTNDVPSSLAGGSIVPSGSIEVVETGFLDDSGRNYITCKVNGSGSITISETVPPQ